MAGESIIQSPFIVAENLINPDADYLYQSIFNDIPDHIRIRTHFHFF